MRIIYVDPTNNHCYTANPDGSYLEVETEHFDGKCDTFVEGHCFAVIDNGHSIYPWKDYTELDNAQREHEKRLIAEYTEALKIMGVTV